MVVQLVRQKALLGFLDLHQLAGEALQASATFDDLLEKMGMGNRDRSQIGDGSQ